MKSIDAIKDAEQKVEKEIERVRVLSERRIIEAESKKDEIEKKILEKASSEAEKMIKDAEKQAKKDAEKIISDAKKEVKKIETSSGKNFEKGVDLVIEKLKE